MTVLRASREAAKATLYAHEPQVASLSVPRGRGKPLACTHQPSGPKALWHPSAISSPIPLLIA